MDNFKLLTVNHKDLNTEDLKHFVVADSDDIILSNSLQEILRISTQSEILYLATCNRVMFLFYGTKNLSAKKIHRIFSFINPKLFEKGEVQLDRISKLYKNREAIRHLIEVASSIDSLVVGEREIFRQFREAYKKSAQLGLCGDNIRITEKCVVQAAKNVYTNTSIGEKPVSIVSLAIQEFLKCKISKGARILLLGAGETNTTVGRFLIKNGYKNLVIFNRSLDNAFALSRELGGEALHLSDLPTYTKVFDAIFACTASQSPILDLATYEKININGGKKLVVDLSIPQNIAPDLVASNQVKYVNIDSLRTLADENLKARSQCISEAKKIIDHYVGEFESMYEQRKIERALAGLSQQISQVKSRALSKVFKYRIEELPEESRQLIEEITDYMAKKCVAVPMKLAKEQLISKSE